MDTGVFVAGLFWRHEAHQCLQAWQHDVFQLVVTDAIFDEYRRVAVRVKDRERLPGDLEPMLRLIQAHAFWVVPEPLADPVCWDPKDDKFIEAALAVRSAPPDATLGGRASSLASGCAAGERSRGTCRLASACDAAVGSGGD